MNLITTTQAAAILGCHINSTVRILDDARVKPVMYIGEARAYRPEAVDMVASRRRRAAALTMIRRFRG